MPTNSDHSHQAPNLPPSTDRLCPVIYPDSSEAKNAIVFAISSGVPNRFNDVFFAHISRISSGVTPTMLLYYQLDLAI